MLFVIQRGNLTQAAYYQSMYQQMTYKGVTGNKINWNGRTSHDSTHMTIH